MSRFDEQLRRLVHHLLPPHLPPLDCEVVVDHGDGTVDVRPAAEGFGPGMMGVPVALIGCFSVKVAPGARCVVEFLDGRRDKPIVTRYLSASFLEVGLEAQQVKIKGSTQAELDGPSISVGGTAVNVRLGKGTNFVAALGDPVAAGAIGTPVNTIVKV